MRPTAIVALVGVALVSTAMLIAAYFFTNKPELETGLVDLHEHARSAEIACLEADGTWVAGTTADGGQVTGVTCEHSQPTKPAPVVTSSSPEGDVECGG